MIDLFQLAFVSFTEFTNAGRCFLPLESESGGYVRSRVFTGLDQVVSLRKKFLKFRFSNMNHCFFSISQYVA